MRPSALALIALVAAALGGAATLVLGRAGGWLGSTTTATYVVTEQAAAPAAARPTARPLTGSGFDPARIYAERSAGVVTIFAFFGASGGALTPESQGSGFVVSEDGTILTSSHVITNAGDAASAAAVRPAQEVYVEFADGERARARVVGWDVFDDVGVLRVDPDDHPVQPLPLGDSASVVVGEPVAAIGSPFGNTDSLSVGVVSATRSIASLTSRYDVVDAIQTDAPINHGNSGGPLFDAAGRVIGINAQIRSGGSSGGGFEGVGFAVPIDAVKHSLKQLAATGHVAYAYVGIATSDLTPGLARHFGYGVLQGAVVDKVEPGTAAERAGLRAGASQRYLGEPVTVGGDVIVAIDGMPVRSGGDVVRIVGERLVPGHVARFAIVRGSKRIVVPVRLAARPTR
jgi:S1-C subfamily serine protease